MTLTAPPPVADPVRRDIDDAVIKEAKRRARRRRWSNGAVAVVLASVAALVAWGPAPPAQNPPPAAGAEPPAGPFPPGGASPDAQLVAGFGAWHLGWVLAYSDASVIMYEDANAHPLATLPRSMPMSDARFVVRRLTDDGLADVRSGAVPLSAFLTDPESVRGLWADPEFRPYDNPLGYVACHVVEGAAPFHASTGVLAQLPVAAQAVLRGTEQTYEVIDGEGAAALQDCFALTNDQAHTLALMSTDQGRAAALDHPSVSCHPAPPLCLSGPDAITLQDVHGADVTLLFHTALPDHVMVARGG